MSRVVAGGPVNRWPSSSFDYSPHVDAIKEYRCPLPIAAVRSTISSTALRITARTFDSGGRTPTRRDATERPDGSFWVAPFWRYRSHGLRRHRFAATRFAVRWDLVGCPHRNLVWHHVRRSEPFRISISNRGSSKSTTFYAPVRRDRFRSGRGLSTHPIFRVRASPPDQ